MIHTHYTLPSPSTEIIGREREADELRNLLLTDEVRLVTLTGPGGIGKTRLAIHVASLMIGNFADGVYFVPLAHVSDPSLFFLTLAQSLDIQPDAAQPLRETVLRYFRQREILLVLDNFEQIIDAATDVALLLSLCARLTILMTSRIVLHVRGEHEYPVPSLALPAVTTSMEVEAMSHYAAVLLFVQRATAVRPGFRLTAANAPAIAEICLRLDGLPLAIELAAARIKLLNPQAMLPRLQHRLQLLRGGAVDLPERQQTLYNTIHWSYELLNGREQQLFRSLAVFHGYWNLEAAMAVCGTDDLDMEEAVYSLIDKSMIQQRQMPNGDTYCILLETLREFAAGELLADSDRDNLYDRHANYYITRTESGHSLLSDDLYGQWIMWIDLSFDNIRSAFQWLCTKEYYDRAARLVAALTGYLHRQGIVGEGPDWIGEILTRVESVSATVAPHTLSKLYIAKGFFLQEAGNIADAFEHYRKGLLLLPDDPMDRQRNAALGFIGIGYVYMRDFDAAEETLREALKRQRLVGDIAAIAKSLVFLAQFLTMTDRVNGAIPLLEESIELSRLAGTHRQLAPGMASLAACYTQYDSDKARTIALESIALAKKFNDWWSEIKAHLVLSDIYLENNDREAALHLQAVLRLGVRASQYRAIIPALVTLCGIFRRWSLPEDALRLLCCTSVLLDSFADSIKLTDYRKEMEILQTSLEPEVFTVVWDEALALSLTSIEALVRTRLESSPMTAKTESGELPALPGVLLQTSTSDYGLTTREKEILQLLARGLSNREIGAGLFISMRTVHAHIRSIYSKINVSSRSAATRFAMEHKL